MPRLRLAMLAVAVATTGTTANGQSPPVRGFPADALAELSRLERQVRATPDTARLRSYLRELTRLPHLAGTAGSKRVADWALAQFRSWGLASSIEVYEGLLPLPLAQRLELLGPTRYRARLVEPPIAEDPDSKQPGVLPAYVSYGADGDVTAELVYANYGLPEDYQGLARLGIDVRGKLVIVRTGPHLRHIKGTEAQRFGALGVIMYHDPMEDGYWIGPVYPEGQMRPAFAVERGGAGDNSFFTGDPLTPGWASKPGGRKLDPEDSPLLQKIPMMSISYGDALPLLRALGGPMVPEDSWKGALPIPYRVGPGPARVRMMVKSEWKSRPIYNVIARIEGKVHPDQWIVIGCHHDAWVYGADDPAAAAASLMETARTFAVMATAGWRPDRTLVFALWDAEEQGHIGSVEWVEDHAEELRQKVVMYFNADNYRKGIFTASGSHTLETFVREVARDTPDPSTGRSVLDVLGQTGRDFALTPVGSGTDYVGFLHYLGVPSVHIAYRNAGRGTYHSVYDSYTYFTRFLDPTFGYGQSQAAVFGAAILRMAQTPVMPWSFTDAARTYRGYHDEIRQHPNTAAGGVDLGSIRDAVIQLEGAAREFDEAFDHAISLGSTGLTRHQEALRTINATIYQSERELLIPGGLPGRPWYQHSMYAQGLYGGAPVKTIPAVREAIEQGRFAEARDQVPVAAAALIRLAARARSTATQLKALTRDP